MIDQEIARDLEKRMEVLVIEIRELEADARKKRNTPILTQTAIYKSVANTLGLPRTSNMSARHCPAWHRRTGLDGAVGVRAYSLPHGRRLFRELLLRWALPAAV